MHSMSGTGDCARSWRYKAVSDIKKRMASVKAKRFRGVVSLPGERQRVARRFGDLGMDPQHIAEFLKRDEKIARMRFFCADAVSYEALDCAKQYFGIADTKHLALLMAEVLFGKHERGRAKGTKTWSYEQYLRLADAASELWKKNPSLSDAENRDAPWPNRRVQKISGRSPAPAYARGQTSCAGLLEDMAADEAKARRKGEL